MSNEILIIGSKGLLGSNLLKLFKRDNFNIIGIDKDILDISKKKEVFEYFSSISPSIIINCAAFIPADKCELNYKESYKANVQGVLNISHAINDIYKQKVLLFHFSSDFVFDGREAPYTEESIPNPLNVYGWHKTIADHIILSSVRNFYIFRIASLIGYSPYKEGFLQKLIKYGKFKGKLEVVSNLKISISTPEFIYNIIKFFIKKKPMYGIYNVVAKGGTSWYEVAKVALELLEIPIEVKPISYKEYKYYVAKRPINTILSVDKLSVVINVLKTWQEVLEDHVRKYYEKYREIYFK